MKKLVLKLDLHDDKEKRKAMKVVSGLAGIESIAMDMKDQKLTVIGSADPVLVVNKLRKGRHVDIVTIGPAKEEKKDEGKKEDEKKKNPDQQMADIYRVYNPYMTPSYPVVIPEEYPNSCVIC